MRLVPKEPGATADISSGHEPPSRTARSALLLVAAAAALWWLLGAAGSLLGAHLPDRWERRIDGAAMLAHGADDAPGLDRARAVLARLTAGQPLRDLDYRVVSVALDDENAVAVPGGGIGVSPALLKAVPSEAGLAFVLAHELGHHQLRHMTRRLGRGLFQALAFAAVLGRQDGGMVARASIKLADNGYSRADERAADAFALRLVHRTYGTTRGALEFFRHMAAKEGTSKWLHFAGTHPATQERIAAMEALQRKLEPGAAPQR